jgi:hypothetical protein
MGKTRQRSSLVHDPLGLLALPIASIDRDRPADDGPQPGTNTSKLLDAEEGLGMAIAAKTIGGALVAVLIAVGLVALPGPAKGPHIVLHCHLEGG